MSAPRVFACGHRAGHAFELCDPLSPSPCPMGEVRRQEGGGEDEVEGADERESRGDAHPPPLTLRSQRDKLNMAAVSTKQTDDIIASAVVVQFPAS